MKIWEVCVLGSSKAKKGWYKNIWCDSSYELAFVIFCLDHNIEIIRNKEGFPYQFGGENHLFYPDFIYDGYYIEIKGFMRDKDYFKHNQFPHKLILANGKFLEPIINYSKEKYGKDFIKLYEGNPHNIKKNKCQICEGPARKIFCSRNCAGKNVAKLRIELNKSD